MKGVYYSIIKQEICKKGVDVQNLTLRWWASIHININIDSIDNQWNNLRNGTPYFYIWKIVRIWPVTNLCCFVLVYT